MKKKFDDGLKEGDIFLMQDGRMVQFIERWPNVDLVYVQFIDRDEQTNFEPKHLLVGKNLGQSDAVVAAFAAARSVHKRMNRLARV